MTNGPDWPRLGRYVTTRRVALGMTTVRALSEATKRISGKGISERTLGALERGQSQPYPSTLAVVELALGWPPGSAARILRGREPAGLAAPEPEPPRYESAALQRIADDPDLPWDEKQALITLARKMFAARLRAENGDRPAGTG